MKECRGESLNNTGSDRSPGTDKERVGQIYTTDPYTSNITIHELQKIKLLGTSHILRKALSIKYASTSIQPSHLGMGSAFELSVVHSLMLKKIMLITKSTADSSYKVLQRTTGKIF